MHGVTGRYSTHIVQEVPSHTGDRHIFVRDKSPFGVLVCVRLLVSVYCILPCGVALSNTAVPQIVQTPSNRTESEACDPRFGPGMIDFLVLLPPCLSTSYRVASPENTEGCSSQERKHARPIDVNWQRRRTRTSRTKNVQKKTTKRSFNVVLPPPLSANRVCFPNPETPSPQCCALLYGG